MNNHGLNAANVSQTVLRLVTKLWWLRAPLTFLHVKDAHECCFGLLSALKAAYRIIVVLPRLPMGFTAIILSLLVNCG